MTNPDSQTQILEHLAAAQQAWSRVDLRQRSQLFGRLRSILASHSESLIASVSRVNASSSEILASEVLPLADAAQFLQKRLTKILKPRVLARHGLARWLGSIRIEQRHEPIGTVFIVGPSNYPLLLPGVQLLQALAAGNAVIIKPAPNCSDCMRQLIECLVQAGLPRDVVALVDEDPAIVESLIAAGVGKVVLTGSVPVGRTVSHLLAEHLTPSAMELSGCDAMIVVEGADLRRVACALVVALQYNGGATCIAPRRVIIQRSVKAELLQHITNTIRERAVQSVVVPSRVYQPIRHLIKQSLDCGASIWFGELGEEADTSRFPILLDAVRTDMPIARADVFAPVASFIAVDTIEEAIAAANQSVYQLGASVFAAPELAQTIAKQISCGCVVLNDSVAPTADPNVSFGGRRHSGWGMTRGELGLLEMTFPKFICTRRGKWLPHLDPPHPNQHQQLSGLLDLFHGQGWKAKLGAVRKLLQARRASE